MRDRQVREATSGGKQVSHCVPRCCQLVWARQALVGPTRASLVVAAIVAFVGLLGSPRGAQVLPHFESLRLRPSTWTSSSGFDPFISLATEATLSAGGGQNNGSQVVAPESANRRFEAPLIEANGSNPRLADGIDSAPLRPMEDLATADSAPGTASRTEGAPSGGFAQLVPVGQQTEHSSVETERHENWRQLGVSMLPSEAKGPPVYKSAPKQISESEIKRSSSDSELAKPAVGLAARVDTKKAVKKLGDLHTAAGHSKGKHDYEQKVESKKKVKKRKEKPKKKPKKKKKRKKKPKKRRKAAKVHEAPVEPSASHQDHGKYYEFRSVPKKGAWKYEYKRGNKKHMIERKEHGHKSHFKTEVKWEDKKGKGHHVFDYNHDKHHGHHQAAAASKDRKVEVKPMGAASSARGEAAAAAAQEAATWTKWGH